MDDVLNKIMFWHTVKGVKYRMHCIRVVDFKCSLSSCLHFISGEFWDPAQVSAAFHHLICNVYP